MIDVAIVPQQQFRRVFEGAMKRDEKLNLIAEMCRINALSAVKLAGSGHLGSSFSALDLIVWLYYEELNVREVGLDSPDRDIFFSSKGHDVPGLYSVLFSLEMLSEELLLRLRRFGGLDGHPDVGIPGIEANSGSLGMGLSKGKGMAWAKRLRGEGGRVFVMTGDGELQEGQNFEALQSAVQQHLDRLTVIVDHNKVQTDKLVSEIVNLGDLEEKFRIFGWHVDRCDGHDFAEIDRALSSFRHVTDRPKALIADTIKGRGVSFMEHPAALMAGNGLYPWHSGAPGDEDYLAAYLELVDRINSRLAETGQAEVILKQVDGDGNRQRMGQEAKDVLGEPVSAAMQASLNSAVSDEYVAEAFGQALVNLAPERKDLVVLDADLASDCRVRSFEETYPDRFIENGIAEQDMVSMAGGLARMGLLPVVNSFASFLAARANEQIYNNASESTKIIYACHYAGLIPAGPGKSHQSIRDVSLLGSLPNITIVQPCNASETQMVVEYCVQQAEESCVIRMVIGPSPRIIELPEHYRLSVGRGVALTEGKEAVLIAYGPVMLHEALLAGELLSERGFGLKVFNMPWLNKIDPEWLTQHLTGYDVVYVLEDHAPVGALGDLLSRSFSEIPSLNGCRVKMFAVEGYPACGRPQEVLRYHGLDGLSLSERILLDQDSLV